MPRTREELVAVGHFMHRGHKLSYETRGSGTTTVVLMHGILLNARMNRPLATAIASRGYKVVLLDLLGHGRSDRAGSG